MMSSSTATSSTTATSLPPTPVHIEILLSSTDVAAPLPTTRTLRPLLLSWLRASGVTTFLPSSRLYPITPSSTTPPPHPLIRRIECDTATATPFWRASLRIYPYTLSSEEISEETLDGGGDDDDATPALLQQSLPAASLESAWSSLKYDSSSTSAPPPTRRLLSYALSVLRFSSLGVSSSVVALNRLALLYGPPGTGKTTLCRALAQKLAIRTSDRFPGGTHLLEIRAHSLFSRWFSESGKTVLRLFDHVRDLIEDEDDALIVLLIDEVESLAGSRKASIAGNEPSDAVRAVNALLTQIDRLRERPNVLVLATSNVTEAIDGAFVDRADLKVYVGPPGREARRAILSEMLGEMERVGVVTSEPESAEAKLGDAVEAWDRATEGLSGRTLRKLPLRAVASERCGGVGGCRNDNDDGEWGTEATRASAFVRAMCEEATRERKGLRLWDDDDGASGECRRLEGEATKGGV